MKEVAFYKQEVNENETKLEEMKRCKDKDIYDIKLFENVLAESYMMVPDSERRLHQAMEDLVIFLKEIDDNQNYETIDKTGEWFRIADQLLIDNHLRHIENQNHLDKDVVTSVDDLAEGEAF